MSLVVSCSASEGASASVSITSRVRRVCERCGTSDPGASLSYSLLAGSSRQPWKSHCLACHRIVFNEHYYDSKGACSCYNCKK